MLSMISPYGKLMKRNEDAIAMESIGIKRLLPCHLPSGDSRGNGGQHAI